MYWDILKVFMCPLNLNFAPQNSALFLFPTLCWIIIKNCTYSCCVPALKADMATLMYKIKCDARDPYWTNCELYLQWNVWSKSLLGVHASEKKFFNEISSTAVFFFFCKKGMVQTHKNKKLLVATSHVEKSFINTVSFSGLQTCPPTFPSTRWTSVPGRSTNTVTVLTRRTPLPNRHSWLRK